jgi:hypothetical protein
MSLLSSFNCIFVFSYNSRILQSLTFFDFSDFEEFLHSYPISRIEEYQRAYSLKASLLGKIASQRLVE